MKKIIFVCSLLLLTVFTQTAFSQTTSIKVGHINSLELLSLMPEVKTADEKIQAEAKALETQFNTMMKEYQAKRSEIESQFEQMDELIKETKIKELQDTEQRIGKFELDAQEKVAKKREELYKPITAKANDAIKAVADANSYVYIFDTSQGSIVYLGKGATDILPMVRDHLGITNTPAAPPTAPATPEKTNE